MKRNFLTLVLCFILFQLTGCATHSTTQHTGAVIEDTHPAPAPEVKAPEPIPEPVPVPVPQAKPPAPAPSIVAVTSLVTQARAQYAAKNYQAAIATAERGLRIDRRSPELYLILAQSYVQLANTQLAQQFVQQGIRYAQAGTEVAQSLAKVKDALPH